MITPEQLKKKARNQYRNMQRAWLDGDESFFPRTIPANRTLPPDTAESIRGLELLRSGSKKILGYGYTIEWTDEIQSRTHGRNRHPKRFVIESRDDLLRLIGKVREFSAFTDAVTLLRTEFGADPIHAAGLERWIRSHITLLTEAAPEIKGSVLVVRYLQDHPRPGIFARELPLPVDTKFVERHKRILRGLLDLLLPPQSIRADETHFERRYGLRYAEPLVMVRWLDPTLREELGVPFDEVAVPVAALSQLPVTNAHVFVVENIAALLPVKPSPEDETEDVDLADPDTNK